MFQWIYRHLPRALRSSARRREYLVLRDVNRAARRHKQRALLVYIVEPFLLPPEDPKFLHHQNKRQARQIARILDEMGFIVDVVDIHNPRPPRGKAHELVISNTVRYAGFSAPVRLYLATTLCHPLHNANLRRRHAALEARGRPPVQRRRIYPEKMPFVSQATSIAGFGNEYTMGSWSDVASAPIYPFNNYGFRDTAFVFEGKDFAAARKSFLYFANKSQVQKGLDLLLEIFPNHPELTLYVCSPYQREPDFCEAYRRELFETPNVHPLGWVTVNSPQFYDLIRTCACVIHPSCSDGQAGSVVQCMYAGAIPVVSREAGIDVEEFGVLLRDDRLEEIERTILEVSQQPEEWHRERSLRTREVAEQRYSEEAFEARWREILTSVLGR